MAPCLAFSFLGGLLFCTSDCCLRSLHGLPLYLNHLALVCAAGPGHRLMHWLCFIIQERPGGSPPSGPYRSRARPSGSPTIQIYGHGEALGHQHPMQPQLLWLKFPLLQPLPQLRPLSGELWTSLILIDFFQGSVTFVLIDLHRFDFLCDLFDRPLLRRPHGFNALPRRAGSSSDMWYTFSLSTSFRNVHPTRTTSSPAVLRSDPPVLSDRSAAECW